MIKGLTELQNELKAPKGKFNSFGKYKYRSCEDILEAVKPLLAKYHLQQTIEDSLELIGDRYYVVATVTLTDGENEITAKGWAREAESKSGMDCSQITGTASSYARKYALNGLYAIDDTKDADTDEYHEQTNSDLATDAEKKDFQKLCADMKLDPVEILKHSGWKNGDVTKDQIAKGKKMIQRVVDERN